MIVRQTRQSDNAALNALFAIAFETTPDKGPAQEDDGRIRHWGAFSEEGELMSSLSVTPFSIRFDEGACPMAGIGAVQTLPPFRRRGGVAACFNKALPALYEDGFVFSYLYPFSTAFYRRFGYESCVTRIACKLDLAQLRLPPREGRFRLARKEAPLADAIRTVDRAWEARWNMEVIHEDEDCDWLNKIDPLTTREYLYGCFDAADEPLGYVAFRTEQEPDGRVLRCSRFRFVSREGFYALLAVFQSLAADHRFAAFSLPGDPALPYLMGEWSLGAASFSQQPAGMVRVVNVKEVLRRAAYHGSGQLRLGIRDELIPENDGVFVIRFENGRAVCVEKRSETPDAVLSISSFSALIAGVCDLDGARDWMDGVQVLAPDAPFERAFYRKSMMISEYF